MGRTKLVLLAIGLSILSAAAYAQRGGHESAVDQLVLVRAPLDKLAPHVPAVRRTEFDHDRIHGAALFAQGRLFFQREQFDRSLQRYQRAYRYSYAPRSVCEEIIPLAYRIGRYDEAFRYLQLATDDVVVDPFVVRRLAIAFAETGRIEHAVWLYEQILRDYSKPGGTPKSARNTRFVTQFELGRLYFLMDRYDDAAELFETLANAMESPEQSGIDQATIDAVQARPEITFVAFAEAFLHAKQFDDAKTYFERAYARSNEDAVLQFELARVAAARKDFKSAEQYLDRYVDGKGTDAGAQPYFLLREIYRATHQNEEVADNALIERLKTCIAAEDYDISLGYVLAEQLVEERRLDEALKLYRKLVRREPLLEAFIGLAQIAWLQEDPASFLSAGARIISETGGIDAAEQLLLDAAKSTEFSKNLASLAASGKVETENEARAKFLLAARLSVLSGQIDSANRFFRRAVEISELGRADVYSVWVFSMLERGMLEQAEIVLKEAIESKVDPTRNADWHYYYAGVLAAQEKKKAAIASATECAQLGAGLPHLEIREAWICYVCDDLERARSSYLKFIRKWSVDYQSVAIRNFVREARMGMSTVCTELGRFDEAVEHLERVLDEFPNDVGASNDLGYLWADRNEHVQRAYRMVKVAVAAEPENAAYRDSLGWALYRLGRNHEALAELSKAVQLEDPDPVVLDHLGDVLLALDQRTEAIATWKRSLNAVEPESLLRSQLESKIQRHAE